MTANSRRDTGQSFKLNAFILPELIFVEPTAWLTALPARTALALAAPWFPIARDLAECASRTI
jgi:hypothetical protein